jgi:hypothetical protein
LTKKTDPDGNAREDGVCNKFRISISEGGRADIKVPTHSSCADDITNRLIAVLAPVLQAEQTSIDVGGAYFHGTPPTMAEGGRRLYAVVPPWLAEFGPYPERAANGRRNLLLITGNMPGRCDAGRIWQARFDRFLRAYGLRQLITDLRVWVLKSARGVLLIHDHVDDSRLTTTTPEARSHFYLAWAIEFNSPPEPLELSENFTGLRHHRVRDRSVEISCLGVIKSLAELIELHPLGANMPYDVPLPAGALRQLQAGPTDKNPLCPHLVPQAQKIGGTIGFITNMVRCDAHFGYCVISRYLNETRLTRLAFKYLCRLGKYIVSTKELCLTLRAPMGPPGQLDLFTVYSDASHGNAEDGRSYGGYVLMCEDPTVGPREQGRGAFAWKVEAPPDTDDSSAGAELKMVARAIKYTIAARTIQRDLDLGLAPTRPTTVYTDAEAVIQGRGGERMTKSTRWLGTRYGMIRWVEYCRIARMAQLDSARNCGDIMTKCLVGPLFYKHRAQVLGLESGADGEERRGGRK